MPNRPINELKSMIGRSKNIVEEMRIEAGKVAEFAHAIGCEDPVYYEQDAAQSAGLRAIPAPVTFLRTSVFPRYRREGLDRDPVFDLGFDKRREVHGEHSFRFKRPIYVGDTLSASTTLVDVYQRESSGDEVLTFAVQELEYRDEEGETVATEQMTLIEVPTTDEAEGER